VLVGDPTTALESVSGWPVSGSTGSSLPDRAGQLLIGRPDLVEASSRLTVVELAELIGYKPTSSWSMSATRGDGGRHAAAARAVPSPSSSALSTSSTLRRQPWFTARRLPFARRLQRAPPRRLHRRLGPSGCYGAWAAAGLPVVTGTKQPGDII